MKLKFKFLVIVLLAISAPIILTALKIETIDFKDLKGAWEQGPAEK